MHKKDKIFLAIFIALIVFAIIAVVLDGKTSSMSLPPEVRAEYNELGKQYSELDLKKLELKRELLEVQAKLDIAMDDLNFIAEEKKMIENDYLSLIPVAEARHVVRTGDRLDLSPKIPIMKAPYKPIVNDDAEKVKLAIKDYLLTHGHSSLHDTEDIWIELGVKHKIKPEIPVCIAWADTRLGKAMATSYNFGNVGNNDRGNRVHFNSKYQGIEKIFETLNNSALGHKQTVGSLSFGGGGHAPIYASSPFNWNNNVLTCLREMYDDPTINESYAIRTE